MNERVFPKSRGIDQRFVISITASLTSSNRNLSSLTQSTLDGAVSTRPHIPQFNAAGLLNYVVKLVVAKMR